MPKMKTRRAVAKRFTAVGKDKFKRKRANLRHLLAPKSSKSKARNVKTDYVNENDLKQLKRCLPYG